MTFASFLSNFDAGKCLFLTLVWGSKALRIFIKQSRFRHYNNDRIPQ